jgi:GNAT superfamily N-acetyltransferase
VPADLVIAPLRPEQRPQLAPLVASAFSGEPFAEGMYGRSRLDRFRYLLDDYVDFPKPHQVVIAASIGDVLVAAAALEPAGTCGLCRGEQAPLAADADVATAIDHEFERRCRAAHAGAELDADHARITTVATLPFLAGMGIGGPLVAATLDHAWSLGAPCVALECLRSRAAFYSRSGFAEETEFDDPGGPGLRALLMIANRPG